MLTVGLLFHSSNSDNLGVGALTVAQVDILRGISRATGIDIAITLFDWAGARPSYVAGQDVTICTLNGATMKDPRRMLALFRACDVIVDIGAGDSFADIYGPARLRRMIYLKYMVHLARRPLVLAPQTFGPFDKLSSRIVARDLIRRAALVATRDAASTAGLEAMGVTRDVLTASDVALRLPPEGVPPVWGRSSIGLNVSGLLMGGGYDGDNQFALRTDYAQTIRALIESLSALPDRPALVLVPHVISPSAPVEDDMAASIRLQHEFPHLTVAPAFTSPGHAKAYISGFDFFAGSRMHSCIAAFSSGVPVVPLAYSGKFAGLFGSIGYEATADVRAMTQNEVISAVVNGYRNRDGLKRQVTVARGMGEQRLRDYVDALTRVMSEVALRKRAGDQARPGSGPRWRALDERL